MTFSRHLHARSGLFAVSGGAVLWGTTGVAVRIIGDRSGLTAVPIGCSRLAIAAVVLALALGRPGLRRTRAALDKHRWALIASGAGLGGYQALYFIGVEQVGVSISTLVSLAVAPIAITAVTAVMRRRMPAAGSFATLVCAMAGLALISLTAGAAAGGPRPVIGVVASLGSGLGYAATTMVNRRLVADGDALLLTGATSAIGAIVLLPIALAASTAWPTDAIASGWLIYIGIVSTVVAYGLFYAGLRTTSPEVAGVLTLLEPLTAAGLAALFLHETLTPLGLCGAGLLLIAIGALYVRRPESDGTPAL
jgi:DME family drug/metabolite transporter